jgi:hypothetical protein
MRTECPQTECSFSKWYPLFDKYAFEAVILPMPEDVCKYLEHDVFFLPQEATSKHLSSTRWEWSDGSVVEELQEVSCSLPSCFSNYITIHLIFCLDRHLPGLLVYLYRNLSMIIIDNRPVPDYLIIYFLNSIAFNNWYELYYLLHRVIDTFITSFPRFLGRGCSTNLSRI